ncbi:hypothetical protein BG000_006411 [Podila horticola]|nr:hypothetical protein BG000_006411 [Podila horticola]
MSKYPLKPESAIPKIPGKRGRPRKILTEAEQAERLAKEQEKANKPPGKRGRPPGTGKKQIAAARAAAAATKAGRN